MSMDKLNAIWKEKFNILCEYKKEFGNCNVPRNFIYKGIDLGTWCYNQRQTFKGNRRNFISNERIDLLNSIGFIWDLNEFNWENNFQLLKEYKEEFGDCNVPQKFIYKNIKLGRWCSTQRQVFNSMKSGYLNKNRIDKLNSIGFEF